MPPQLTDPKPLNRRLTKRLLAYSAVTGAIAAGAPRAAAEVVYTPVHKDINLQYPLDRDGDGIEDFKITTSYLSGFNQVLVSPRVAFNKVVVVGKGCIQHKTGAAPLPLGATIGPAKALRHETACLASLFSFYSDGHGSCRRIATLASSLRSTEKSIMDGRA